MHKHAFSIPLFWHNCDRSRAVDRCSEVGRCPKRYTGDSEIHAANSSAGSRKVLSDLENNGYTADCIGADSYLYGRPL